MKTNQINHAPPGAPIGGQLDPVLAIGAPGGVLSKMKTPEPMNLGTMDYYRELAKTNPDIDVLVGMIDRQGKYLTQALEACVKTLPKTTKQRRDA